MRAYLLLRLMMRCGSTGWLASIVVISIAVVTPTSICMVTTRLEIGDVGFQAGIQGSRATTRYGFCQEARHVITCELPTRIGFILSRQELRVGQQHVDLAIAKNAVGINRSSIGCSALEGSLVQGTNSLYVIASAAGA